MLVEGVEWEHYDFFPKVIGPGSPCVIVYGDGGHDSGYFFGASVDEHFRIGKSHHGIFPLGNVVHGFEQASVADDAWVFGYTADFIGDGFGGDNVTIGKCFCHRFLNLLLVHRLRARPLS